MKEERENLIQDNKIENNKKEKNEKEGRGLFYFVIAIAVIIIAIVGATYAFFTASTRSENSITTSSASLDLKLETDIKKVDRIRTKYSNDKILFRYYFEESSLSQYAYRHTDDLDKVDTIKILLPSKKVISLEKYSPIVKGLIEDAKNTFNRIYYGKGE